MPKLTPADQLARFRLRHTRVLSEVDHLRLLAVILNLRDAEQGYTLPAPGCGNGVLTPVKGRAT